MNLGAVLHGNRDKFAAFAAALLLHSIILYGLLSYRIIPPPSEALTLFVSIVNPAAPAETAQLQPVVPKPVRPARKREEVPGKVSPVASQLMARTAPVIAPTEPVAAQPPAARALPTPAAVMIPGDGRPPTVPMARSAAPAPQTVPSQDELSVSCSERTPPVYPKQSLRLGEQGKTVLLVELNELGRVSSVTIKAKSGFPRLDEAAISAVKTWRCTPAKHNGVAVRSVAVQPFNFTLKGR